VAYEQGETAAQEIARPDLASTPAVDEHGEGGHVSARYAAAADTTMAQAAALAAQAFPGPCVVRRTFTREAGPRWTPADRFTLACFQLIQSSHDHGREILVAYRDIPRDLFEINETPTLLGRWLARNSRVADGARV